MQNPVILIFYLTESLFIAIIGRAIFGIPSRKPIIQFTLINAILVYFIRTIWLIYGFPLGINTIIQFIVSFLIFRIVCKIKTNYSFYMVVIGYMSIILNELFILKFSLAIFNTNLNEIFTNVNKHLVVGMFNNLTLFMAVPVITLIKKTIKGWVISDHRKYFRLDSTRR